jgi:hypothetical protein
MIGKLASSTTATIAISLVVLIGMYILYRDMKKLEVSIEKLQTRSACAKVLATPPVSVIEEDDEDEEEEEEDDEEEDDDEEEVITIQEAGSVVEDDIEIALNKLKDEMATEKQS